MPRLKKMSESDEAILAAVKARLSQLEGLLEAMDRDYEDGLYRFYHQSFKVYSLQAHTTRAAGLIRAIAGEAGRRTDPWFEAIVAEGTGIEFDPPTTLSGRVTHALRSKRFFTRGTSSR